MEADALESLSIDGNQDFEITNAIGSGSNLENLDASELSGDLNIDVSTSTEDMTITLNSADADVTLGTGADEIDASDSGDVILRVQDPTDATTGATSDQGDESAKEIEGFNAGTAEDIIGLGNFTFTALGGGGDVLSFDAEASGSAGAAAGSTVIAITDDGAFDPDGTSADPNVSDVLESFVNQFGNDSAIVTNAASTDDFLVAVDGNDDNTYLVHVDDYDTDGDGAGSPIELADGLSLVGVLNDTDTADLTAQNFIV
jgi:hypothetical protein